MVADVGICGVVVLALVDGLARSKHAPSVAAAVSTRRLIDDDDDMAKIDAWAKNETLALSLLDRKGDRVL